MRFPQRRVWALNTVGSEWGNGERHPLRKTLNWGFMRAVEVSLVELLHLQKSLDNLAGWSLDKGREKNLPFPLS